MLSLQYLKTRLHVWPRGKELKAIHSLCCKEAKIKKLADMSTDHPTRRDVCWGRLQTITESLILLVFYFWSEFEL